MTVFKFNKKNLLKIDKLTTIQLCRLFFNYLVNYLVSMDIDLLNPTFENQQ